MLTLVPWPRPLLHRKRINYDNAETPASFCILTFLQSGLVGVLEEELLGDAVLVLGLDAVAVETVIVVEDVVVAAVVVGGVPGGRRGGRRRSRRGRGGGRWLRGRSRSDVRSKRLIDN